MSGSESKSASKSRSAMSSALDLEYIIPKEFKPFKMPGSHFSFDNREVVKWCPFKEKNVK